MNLQNFFLVFTLFFTIAFNSAFADESMALVDNKGDIVLTQRNVKFSPFFSTEDWAKRAHAVSDAATNNFHLQTDKSERVNGTFATAQISENSIRFEYNFESQTTITLDTFAIAGDFPLYQLKNHTYETDKGDGIFPENDTGNATIFSNTISFLKIKSTTEEVCTFRFEKPTQILLQDNRRWGQQTVSLRIIAPAPRPLAIGAKFSVSFEISMPEKFTLSKDEPVTLKADGKKWIPVHHALDVAENSALDFSRLVEWHSPAGKFGWLKTTNDGHFAFEKQPSVPLRFFGVNLCFSASFLTKEQSTALAVRLRKMGYNTVRIHHHDNAFVEGNQREVKLNAQKLDQFDFLVSELIKNGIYITTDLFVSRSVPWKNIGIERDGMIPMDTFKILCAVHPGAMADWKKFTREFLTHKNQYTGRTYADEPALAWLSLINEGNLGNFISLQKDIPEFSEKWHRWLDEKKKKNDTYGNITYDIPNGAWENTAQCSAYLQFLADAQQAMAEEMKDFLKKEIKSKALITNENAWTHKIYDTANRQKNYDYIDDHFYIDHPDFIEKSWQLPSRCPNENPFKNALLGMRSNAFTRMAEKPFTISEYNFSGPGRYRGVGGMTTGAIAALQDWDILWRFAYSHSDREMFNPAPMGYFNTVSDPVMAASERASFCIFMRKDVAPLATTLNIEISQNDTDGIYPNGAPNLAPNNWIDVAWKTKVALAPKSEQERAQHVGDQLYISAKEAHSKEGGKMARKLTEKLPFGGGAITVDETIGKFTINTPLTAGGFAEAGEIITENFRAENIKTPASIWASSLDGKPLKNSARILIAHITDIQNTNIRYAETARKTLLAWGGLPHIAEEGSAIIVLAREKSAKKIIIYRLANNGERLARVPSAVEKDTVTFIADNGTDPTAATLYYEVVVE